jgi:hypothetical protein
MRVLSILNSLHYQMVCGAFTRPAANNGGYDLSKHLALPLLLPPLVPTVPTGHRSCSKRIGRIKDHQASACFQRAQQNASPAAKILSLNERPQIAANIAKLPKLLQGRAPPPPESDEGSKENDARCGFATSRRGAVWSCVGDQPFGTGNMHSVWLINR